MAARGNLIKKVMSGTARRLAALWATSKRHLRTHSSRWIVSIIVLLLLLAILWPSVFVTIHSGEAGVYYKRFGQGTVVDKVYGEGFHVVAPWDRLTVYNVRFQTKTHQMDVLTAKGLRIRLTLAVRFVPEYAVLGVLHQKVGPDYFAKIIIPNVEGTIRQIVGTYDVEELYASDNKILQKLTNEVFTAANDKFIIIDSLLVTNIELPPKIKDAIEQKQEQQQLSEAYIYRLARETKEAERKEIEAKGIREANAIISSSLNEDILLWKGIDATLDVAKSPNSKIVLFGSGKTALPLLFDTSTATPEAKSK